MVVVYDMPEQAMNTVRSLTTPYQRGVEADEYEVLVVENRSERTLDAGQVRQLGPNVHYWLREEPGQSPASAVNETVGRARGRSVAIMVDGARMVTPGVVANLIRAQRLAGIPVVSVPGYHLGQQLHQDAVRDGYSAEQEQAMLAAMDWYADGYRLFGRAVLSASCAGGYLLPIGESNCVAVPLGIWHEVGGFDERFVTMGGGYVNLDFYRRVVEWPGTELIVLPGEGTFHQFHGGATTGAPGVDRDALLDSMRDEYERIRGVVHAPPVKSPVLLGEVPAAAAGFLAHSAGRLA